jgi:hypothetical protein
MMDVSVWVALAATFIAALLTASKLGARVTGWSFVIFTIGAVAWIVVGAATAQPQLLYSNIFLGVIDVFGIWRWLGRKARISDVTASEVERSKQDAGEALFSLGSLDGLPVKTPDGETLAYMIDALAACAGGQIDYFIVRTGGLGGVGETLHRPPWSKATIGDGYITTKLSAQDVARLTRAGEV